MTDVVGRIAFPAIAPPINDNFANAFLITGASGTTQSFEITKATVEVDEPYGSTWWDPEPSQTIWFVWVAPLGGTAVFDTHLSTGDANSVDSFGALDTTLAVWTGTMLIDLVEEGSNDDMDANTDDLHWWSQVTITALAATTYYIQVGTFYTSYVGSVILSYVLT